MPADDLAPWARYIEDERGTMSRRKAAERAGRSDAWWKNLIRGFEERGGHRIPVVLKPEQLIRMAGAVGADLAKAFELAGFDAPTPEEPTYVSDKEGAATAARLSTDVLVAELARRARGENREAP